MHATPKIATASMVAIDLAKLAFADAQAHIVERSGSTGRHSPRRWRTDPRVCVAPS